MLATVLFGRCETFVLIAVTQRVEVIEAYGETRDCLDQKWAELLSSINCSVLPVPNLGEDVSGWISDFNIDGIILSGGNDLGCLPNGRNSSSIRDLTERLLLNFSESTRMPVVGVCRGMQHIFSHLGGQLQPVNSHVAQRHALKPASTNWSQALPAEVNSFHDWGIMQDDLPDTLQPLALAPDNTVEAFTHSFLPWLGIMWHPERESPWVNADQTLLLDHFQRGS